MSNEKLQRWALLAEIAGGMALIVTLVILIFEVRNNAEAAQADTYDRLQADFSQWRMDHARLDALVE